jgi:hypothetical protein
MTFITRLSLDSNIADMPSLPISLPPSSSHSSCVHSPLVSLQTLPDRSALWVRSSCKRAGLWLSSPALSSPALLPQLVPLALHNSKLWAVLQALAQHQQRCYADAGEMLR